MDALELQKKLQEKQNKLASIVGEKEAIKMMNKALKLVKEGKKSITDLIEM